MAGTRYTLQHGDEAISYGCSQHGCILRQLLAPPKTAAAAAARSSLFGVLTQPADPGDSFYRCCSSWVSHKSSRHVSSAGKTVVGKED